MTSPEAEYFPRPSGLTYFGRGRVALWAILETSGIGPEDEVIIPGYTCVAVPNAVLYTGATPVYADIDPNYYTLTRETVSEKVTNRTRAVVAQSMYGLSPDLAPLYDLAENRDLLLIEDCAQGLGGRYRGRKNGTIADAAFFSTQWSKPISTGRGGIAYTEDDGLNRSLQRMATRMDEPSIFEVAGLVVQLLLRPLERRRIFHYEAVRLYRWITRRLGLVQGSITSEELCTSEMPDGYSKVMSGVQKYLWRRRLRDLPAKTSDRRRVAKFYDRFFTSIGTGIKVPERPAYAHHAMLRYPVRLAHKETFLDRCRSRGIPVGDWFCSPIHPVHQDNWREWAYRPGECPEAERACSEVVNLFTDSKSLSLEELREAFEPYL